MDVISTVSAMMKARDSAERPLGLVPTMGYLHQGHMTLVEQARNDNKSVVASIFVNPTQFGPGEDLGGYPRDFERDVAMLAGQGVDIVFAPDPGQMYPPGYSTYVDVGEMGERLEGKHRPGHFRGVVTVVTKLLTIVRPDRAYFGQKDGQQKPRHQAAQPGPQPGGANRRHAHGARAGRPGNEQPQRIPHSSAEE